MARWGGSLLNPCAVGEPHGLSGLAVLPQVAAPQAVPYSAGNDLFGSQSLLSTKEHCLGTGKPFDLGTILACPIILQNEVPWVCCTAGFCFFACFFFSFFLSSPSPAPREISSFILSLSGSETIETSERRRVLCRAFTSIQH